MIAYTAATAALVVVAYTIAFLLAFAACWYIVQDIGDAFRQAREADQVHYYEFTNSWAVPKPDLHRLRPLPADEDRFFDWAARDDCLFLMDAD